MKRLRIVATACVSMALAGSLLLAETASAQSVQLVGWGLNANFQASPVDTNVISGASAIAAGYFHSLALKSGRVWAWGNNSNGQTNVPTSAQSGVTNIAAGGSFSLALQTNGAVVVWGADFVATNVPISATSGVTQIAAGESHALALKNGGILAWGSNTFGQCDVPVELTSGVTNISAGAYYSMALKNGGVQVFGIPATNEWAYSIRSVPVAATSGVSAISAGRWHALALKNGGVIAWGSPFFDATNVPAAATSGVSAIAAGDLFSMALKTNGTLVIWGDTSKGQAPIPDYATNGIAKIAAGVGHCLAISSGMPPRFLWASLPVGYPTIPYNGTISATGAPKVVYYKAGMAWKSWIQLDTNTGAITGTPTTNDLGIHTITVMVSNVYGQVTNAYQFNVQPLPQNPPVFVTTNPLPDGVVGEPYSKLIVASNTLTFTLFDGSLPAGLNLETNGLVSGTPTTAEIREFVVRATNIVGGSNRTYQITINPPPEPPVIVTPSPLPSGLVGQPYSLQIVASNNASFSLMVGDLPSGLTLSTNGLLSGTPTQAGLATFVVLATNVAGSDNREYELEIFGPPVFATASPLSEGSVGEAYAVQITATGNPTFSLFAGSLPGGLNLDSGGLLSGMPSAPGLFNFTVRATNNYGWSNRVYEVQIKQLPVFITTSPLPSGQAGVAYSQQIVASNATAFSLFAGSLPGGLNLGSGGLLSGTPTNTGLFNFTVRATNDYGGVNRAFDLTILSQYPPQFTYIRATNGNIRLEWVRSNVVDNVQVWRATNITAAPVPWTNLGVQISPWTNVAPPMPAYYQLRIVP
jgi:alpha-tubulin suppressor-like RCC1 family protein